LKAISAHTSKNFHSNSKGSANQKRNFYNAIRTGSGCFNLANHILSLLLELQCLLSFLSMHIDRYRHQRSPNNKPLIKCHNNQVKITIVKLEPKQLAHDKSHQSPLISGFDLEAKASPVLVFNG